MPTLPPAHGLRYQRPSTLEDALALMAEAGAMVLAGGQTLIPRLIDAGDSPNLLVDLGGLQQLKQIEVGEELRIGAMVSLSEVMRSQALRKLCPLLPQCAEKTASPAVRNRATLVGNLAWADPCSQLAVAALALDALLCLVSKSGSRMVPAQEFFRAPHRTAVESGEMITHLHVRAVSGRTGSSLFDVAARANSRPLASAAAVITLDAAERVLHASLAIGGCSDIPKRCPVAEAQLIGAARREAPNRAADALREHPPEKGRCVPEADYALAVLPVLLRKAVQHACDAAQARSTA